MAVAAALVAAAVPVFANGAGPASAANTTAAVSRSAVVVCPAGTTRQHSALRIERGGRQRKHGRPVRGCKCFTGTPTGATGQTGKWGSAACSPCPVLSSAAASSAAKKLYAGHPILRRLHRVVRRFLCDPCPPSGATGATGSTTSMPTIFLCRCPRGGATGSTGSTVHMPAISLCTTCPPAGATGATGSTAMPDARILPLLRCHRPPCLSSAGTVKSSGRVAWFDCGPCPRPLTSMARLFGPRGPASPAACNPCPATGSTGASGSTGATGTTGGTHPTFLGRPAMFACICPFVHVQWSEGATGASGATSMPCGPPICEAWGSAGATGATGSTMSTGYACPGPPKPCIRTSTTAGANAQWCGGPIPCGPPVASAARSQDAYVCPMVAPQSGASVSA